MVYGVMNHLILLKILNMINMKKVSLQRFIIFIIKSILGGVLKIKICQTKNLWKSYPIQSPYADNIKDADLAEIELITKFDK